MAGLEFREEERQTTGPQMEAPAESRLRLVRRPMAPVPLGWMDSVRHAAFVGMILAMAFAPGGVEKKIGVVGFALSYALNLASRQKPRREADEEILDDEGVTQMIQGRTTRMRWDEIGHFAADHLAMGAFGLHDRSGHLRMIFGRTLNESGGPVTCALWNRMARIVAERVPYDGTEADPKWRAYARGARWRLFAAIAGIALCLSPILLRTLVFAFDGKLGLFLVFLLIVLGPFFIGIPFLLQAGKGKPGFLTQPVAEDADLSAFLNERAGSLEPTALQLGTRYRYLSSVTANASGMLIKTSVPHMVYVAMMQASLLLRSELILNLSLACCLVTPLGDLYRYVIGYWLSRGRHAEFSVADGNLVVHTKRGVRHFPLSSVRLLSNRSWFDFGGEVEEYRNGWRRFYLDRRFLVPVETEPSRSDV